MKLGKSLETSFDTSFEQLMTEVEVRFYSKNRVTQEIMDFANPIWADTYRSVGELSRSVFLKIYHKEWN